MQLGTLSRWLWLSLIVDTLLVVSRFWYIASRTVRLLPYRTAIDWAREPDLILFAVLFLAGLFGIVMAFSGECRPLVYWNVCYLAVVVTADFSLSMDMASFISRFTIERSLLIAAPVLAALGLCIDSQRRALPVGE
jgi:fucose 4-O-acetylase-like acetyltransferase